MNKTRKPGPKPLALDLKRNVRVGVNLTENELAALAEKAEASHLSIAVYIREAALHRKIRCVTPELLAVLRQLYAVSFRLNKAAASGNESVAGIADEISRVIEKVHETL